MRVCFVVRFTNKWLYEQGRRYPFYWGTSPGKIFFDKSLSNIGYYRSESNFPDNKVIIFCQLFQNQNKRFAKDLAVCKRATNSVLQVMILNPYIQNDIKKSVKIWKHLGEPTLMNVFKRSCLWVGSLMNCSKDSPMILAVWIRLVVHLWAAYESTHDSFTVCKLLLLFILCWHYLWLTSLWVWTLYKKVPLVNYVSMNLQYKLILKCLLILW